MAIPDSAARRFTARIVPSMLLVACALPGFAQSALAEQPDALDHLPPILKSISVSGSVNAQLLNQYVTVSLKVTDNLSGVASFLVDFRSPSGMHHVSRLKEIPNPRTEVVSEVSLGSSPYSDPPFLKFSQPGTWILYEVTASDAAGNSVTYNESQLRSFKGNHGFVVTNNGGYDITPPQLASGTIDTANVHLSKEPLGLPEGTPPYVGGRISMTDSGNGVVAGSYAAHLMFCLVGSGSCQSGNTNTFTMSNVTNRTGLVANTLMVGTQLSGNQLPGNYLIYSLELLDSAGSHAKLLSSDFNGGNFDFHNYFPLGTSVFLNQH